MLRTTMVTLGCLTAVALGAGAARAQLPENVTLLKQIDRGEDYSGNWGYTAPDGTELAISGTYTGTTFIDATDPVNAYEVEFIPGPNAVWREIATYGQYCYIVSQQWETAAGLQIVSLIDPLNPTLVATLNPPDVPNRMAHEIKIDQQTGYCYLAGTDVGMVILDLTVDPVHPPVRGMWDENYVHDLSIKDGKAYIASINDGRVYPLDVSQPGTPTALAPYWTYPGAATHNTWPTADGNYLVTTDEIDGGHLRMWDIRNLNQPEQTGEYIPVTGSIVHNGYVRGRYCYMSHYLDGFRAVDISDPFNLVSVGWYDTHPLLGPGYDGAWGCYCFAADPRIVYISDVSSGTYILRFEPPGFTGIEEPAAETAAQRPVFLSNSPNPFNPETAIRFKLAQAGAVKLQVFDAAGRGVRVLADRSFAAGQQSVTWDGRDDAARLVASGVYYHRLLTPEFLASGSMVLNR